MVFFSRRITPLQSWDSCNWLRLVESEPAKIDHAQCFLKWLQTARLVEGRQALWVCRVLRQVNTRMQPRPASAHPSAWRRGHRTGRWHRWPRPWRRPRTAGRRRRRQSRRGPGGRQRGGGGRVSGPGGVCAARRSLPLLRSRGGAASCSGPGPLDLAGNPAVAPPAATARAAAAAAAARTRARCCGPGAPSHRAAGLRGGADHHGGPARGSRAR